MGQNSIDFVWLGSPDSSDRNILAGKTRTEYRQRFSTEHFIDGRFGQISGWARASLARSSWPRPQAIAKNNGGKVHEVLVKQGYATSEQVMQAMADMHGYEFFDLRDVPIPPSVVELVPESVARENAVIPLAEEDGALKVLVSDPFDYETFEKLQFILNRKVNIALATRESILEAINRNYGQMGDESADSMLQEFTDTAIDFTETEEEAAATGTRTSTKPAPRSCGWCS